MFSESIKQWFSEEWGGGLILPDGWFGRPYDNQHSLTSVNESDGNLTVILDKNLKLSFSGVKRVEADPSKLTIGPFEELRFEWTPYGGGAARSTDYGAGVVQIVSAPGS